jgi:hypothetical protein
MSLRQLSTAALFVGILATMGCQDREKFTGKSIGTERAQSRHAGVEYVTAVVTLQEGDSITVHVLNYSDAEQTCQIEIYRDTRAGAKEVADNEGFKMKSRGVASCRHTVKAAGEYWVLVKGETSPLVPQATFGKGKSEDAKGGALTEVVFKPGDFVKVEAAQAYGRGATEREIRATDKETRAIKRTEKD